LLSALIQRQKVALREENRAVVTKDWGREHWSMDTELNRRSKFSSLLHIGYSVVDNNELYIPK
jgi:hypothetical protein